MRRAWPPAGGERRRDRSREANRTGARALGERRASAHSRAVHGGKRKARSNGVPRRGRPMKERSCSCHHSITLLAVTHEEERKAIGRSSICFALPFLCPYSCYRKTWQASPIVWPGEITPSEIQNELVREKRLQGRKGVVDRLYVG